MADANARTLKIFLKVGASNSARSTLCLRMIPLKVHRVLDEKPIKFFRRVDTFFQQERIHRVYGRPKCLIPVERVNRFIESHTSAPPRQCTSPQLPFCKRIFLLTNSKRLLYLYVRMKKTPALSAIVREYIFI